MDVIDKIKQDWQQGKKLVVVFGLSGIATIFALLVCMVAYYPVVFLSFSIAMLTLMGANYIVRLFLEGD